MTSAAAWAKWRRVDIERAHDAVTDGFRQTGDAIRRQPADRHRHWRGLGLPIRPCDWRPQQAGVSARDYEPASFRAGALLRSVATALTLSAFATPAGAATGSTSIERPASTWEVSGSGLKLPRERLGARYCARAAHRNALVIERERFPFSFALTFTRLISNRRRETWIRPHF